MYIACFAQRALCDAPHLQPFSIHPSSYPALGASSMSSLELCRVSTLAVAPYAEREDTNYQQKRDVVGGRRANVLAAAGRD
jgi:hypothetical protein